MDGVWALMTSGHNFHIIQSINFCATLNSVNSGVKLMKAHLTVFVLSAILIASSSLAPAFGQTQSSIVVTTDKTSYSEGETILVTGKVKDLYSGIQVSVIVMSFNGNRVALAQLPVDADKKFSVEFTAGGNLMKEEGKYDITVQYGDKKRIATTSFQFTGSTDDVPHYDDDNVTEGTFKVEGSGDLVTYEIKGGKLLGIVPDPDGNSLIISIEATEDGSITITIPRTVLDAVNENGQDEDFFVFVDNHETDHDEMTPHIPPFRSLTIEFPAGAQEIEIVGTFVIPEFGTIAVMILAAAIISIIAISAKSRLSIIQRY